MAAKRVFICLLFAIFGICVLLTLAVCIPDSQFSLPADRMVIYSLLCCSACLIFTYILGNIGFLSDKTYKQQQMLLFVCLLGYSVLLYLLSTRLGCLPINDDKQVRDQALYIVGLSDVSDWGYFACYGNNTPPCILLSWILRLGMLLKMKNPVHLAFWCNILQIDVAAFCIWQLILMFCQSKWKYALAWTGVGILCANLAAIGHTQSTYTDAMSFMFGILAFYLWCHSQKTGHKKWEMMLAFFAGVCWGIGASIKMTAVISLLAVGCHVILSGGVRRHFRGLLSVVLAFSIIFVGFKCHINTLPCAELKAEYGFPPFTYFLAVGMKGDGSYIQNVEYIHLLLRTQGLEAREAATLQYIADNIHEFGNRFHILLKLKCNFAFGTFGSEEFTEIWEKTNILTDIFTMEGQYFKHYAMAATSYFYALLILLASGVFAVVYRILKLRDDNPLYVVTIFALMGIMLYVMLFEANNRQLYNHIPWFVLGAVIGIEGLITMFTSLAFHGKQNLPAELL